ncbi:hypothetical protein [Prolixibacter bellariivorans]|uniref:hypothetical protein n=1 Tax=Prolixibacter bellariivorans TaxID=314319 RepID=UPI001298FDA3|nr:hypothetical protein [Prolixibacter bellariivorans]
MSEPDYAGRDARIGRLYQALFMGADGLNVPGTPLGAGSFHPGNPEICGFRVRMVLETR